MLKDKIKTILATETSDIIKIDRLADDLEKLFAKELVDATVRAIESLNEDTDG